MAKRWNPEGKPVSPQERVGRRLFDLPELAGASEDQYYSRVKFTQFWDNRTSEVSLDRLGRSNIESKVRNYLVPRALHQGTTFNREKKFGGWAHIKAQDLTKAKYPPSLVISASPVHRQEDDDELIENIFHAHVEKQDNSYLMALHLRNLYETAGAIDPYDVGEDCPGAENLLTRFRDWCICKAKSLIGSG